MSLAHLFGVTERLHVTASERSQILGPQCCRHHTVATGVTGEPAAPGSRNGGAVSRKALRLFARSQSASSVRYHSSPRWMPSLNRQCSCSGSEGPRCGRRGSAPSVEERSTARLSLAIAASPL